MYARHIRSHSYTYTCACKHRGWQASEILNGRGPEWTRTDGQTLTGLKDWIRDLQYDVVLIHRECVYVSMHWGMYVCMCFGMHVCVHKCYSIIYVYIHTLDTMNVNVNIYCIHTYMLRTYIYTYINKSAFCSGFRLYWQ
jgi:hypothetical protein